MCQKVYKKIRIEYADSKNYDENSFNEITNQKINDMYAQLLLLTQDPQFRGTDKR